MAECVDLCVSCSSAVRTFANLQVVGDEKYLAPMYMPPGGCACLSTAIDPTCARCFPAQLVCQPCGERMALPPGQHPADHTPRAEQGGES